jgi:hypothetical protein
MVYIPLRQSLLNLGREIRRSEPIQYFEFSRLQEHGLGGSEVFLVVFLGNLFLVIEVSRSNIMTLACTMLVGQPP